jgi:ribosomal protein L7/L12
VLIEEAVKLAQTMKGQGAETETILSRLRASGATIIESLKVIRQIENINLTEAKRIVDSSATWADKRDGNERIRRMLIKALDEECAQQNGSDPR